MRPSYFTHHLWTDTLKVKYVKQGGKLTDFPHGEDINNAKILHKKINLSHPIPPAIKCLHKESTHKR